MILMTQYVSYGLDLLPRNLRPQSFDIVGHGPTCLRNDFYGALDGVLKQPIATVVVQCFSHGGFADTAEFCAYVLERVSKFPRHQNTRVAERSIAGLRRGCSPSLVVMSTGA